MRRTAWLAALVLTLAPRPSAGQAGGAPAGAEGAASPPMVALREAGGFGGGGEVEAPIERTVSLEMEGGQKLEGTIAFRPIVVDSDLGRYTIQPGKIKMIQFLRRANVDDAPADDQPQRPRANRGNMPGAMGMGMMMRPETLVRGKVVTTSGHVIIGDIHIPQDFALELEFGHLTPAPDKLRVLTMLGDKAAAPAPVAPPVPPAAPNEPAARRPPGPGRPDTNVQ